MVSVFLSQIPRTLSRAFFAAPNPVYSASKTTFPFGFESKHPSPPGPLLEKHLFIITRGVVYETRCLQPKPQGSLMRSVLSGVYLVGQQ